jgi:hypothetical protein
MSLKFKNSYLIVEILLNNFLHVQKTGDRRREMLNFKELHHSYSMGMFLCTP